MTSRLKSESMVIQAPMSFTGATKRLWRITYRENPWLRWLLAVPAAVLLVAVAWMVVLAWYVLFGFLVAPYRLLRRGSRKRKLTEQRHREMLAQR